MTVGNGRCPVHIRVWSPDPPGQDGEFRCRLKSGHTLGQHRATGLFSWQTLTWFDGDRRCYVGEFTACDQSTCVLPAGHRGEHA